MEEIHWTGSHEQLTSFIENINKVHPTIKFTYEVSNSELPFLYVVVYKGPTLHINWTLKLVLNQLTNNCTFTKHLIILSVKKAIPKEKQ